MAIIPMIGVWLATSQKVIGNQSGAEVTVYNGGYSFIKEIRTLGLKAGNQTVEISNVPSTIDPTSVAIEDLTTPNGFDVLEQNYRYDLISPEAILAKAIGQQVTLIQSVNGKEQSLTGTMLAAPNLVTSNSGFGQTYVGMVLRTADGSIILNPAGELIVKSIPDGLISKPTLVWDLNSKQAGPVQAQVSFLANQMNWHANYVFTIGTHKSVGNLAGWVTVENHCGTTFKNAHLNLLAGTVNRVRPPQPRYMGMAGVAMAGAAPPSFRQQSMFEYHLYKLQRPTTIGNNETKQISLLNATGVSYEKHLVFYGSTDPGPNGGTEKHLRPTVEIRFMNTKANHLGMPLPVGIFRIYQQDRSGDSQFIGEDSVEQTPKDESVTLNIGQSFDVEATRTQVSSVNLPKNSFRITYKIEIRNHHDTAESVYVQERQFGSFKVESASDKYTKLSSSLLQFKLEMPANSTHTLTYTAIVTP